MTIEQIPALGRKLGFPKESWELLQQALTHRTYAVEHNLAYDNQRLEFLGDAVLEIIHTEYLYRRYPELPEGDMTKIRSALSCESTLAEIARDLELGSYILIGNGEKECMGNQRDSTLCDLFEAILGAMYLSCGLKKTEQFVCNCFEQKFPEPKELLNTLNPKGRLQEYAQHRWRRAPEYILLCSSGPPHAPSYIMEAHVNRFRATGSGNSRKNAEIAAATKMVRYLSKRFKF